MSINDFNTKEYGEKILSLVLDFAKNNYRMGNDAFKDDPYWNLVNEIYKITNKYTGLNLDKLAGRINDKI